MSYLRLEHRVLNDSRVLDLTPAAVVAHLYGLDWSNEQASDGAIPAKVAHRMMCQLEPVDIAAAIAELVDAGLWEHTEDGYVCPEFLAYGLEGDEQTKTRAKWSQDKRRRRLHSIGNHALCTPAGCAAKKSEVDNSTAEVDSAPPRSGAGVDSAPPRGGRLDQTRPDPTPQGRGGSGGGNASAAGKPQEKIPDDKLCEICRRKETICRSTKHAGHEFRSVAEAKREDVERRARGDTLGSGAELVRRQLGGTDLQREEVA